MSDVSVTPPETNPTAKGASTSEFKFALVVAAVSGLIGTFESVALILKDAYPTAWWVPLLVGLSGMLGAAAAYLKSRSTVKVAMLESGTALALAQPRPVEVAKPNP